VLIVLLHPYPASYADEPESDPGNTEDWLDIKTDKEGTDGANSRLRNVDLVPYELFTGKTDDRYRVYEEVKIQTTEELKQEVFVGSDADEKTALTANDKDVLGKLEFSDISITGASSEDEAKNNTLIIVVVGIGLCVVTVIATRIYYRHRRRHFTEE
jgi:hypothetical protein